MTLTENFTDEELGVAGCEPRLLDNARYLCDSVLEKVRAHFGLPVRVHDGHRDATHNARVGGKQASFHLFEDGKAAADFDVLTLDMRTVFDWMRLNSGLQFDKVILESKGGVPRCIHVQTDRGAPPRREAYLGETGSATTYTRVECK